MSQLQANTGRAPLCFRARWALLCCISRRWIVFAVLWSKGTGLPSQERLHDYSFRLLVVFFLHLGRLPIAGNCGAGTWETNWFKTEMQKAEGILRSSNHVSQVLKTSLSMPDNCERSHGSDSSPYPPEELALCASDFRILLNSLDPNCPPGGDRFLGAAARNGCEGATAKSLPMPGSMNKTNTVVRFLRHIV